MSFIADKQTLEDLNITGKYKSDSIFNLFNKVHTSGGEKLLETMFNNLLSDPEEINRRSTIFKYFQNKALDFPFKRNQFDIMEDYLSGDTDNNFIIASLSNFKKQVLGSVIRDQQYAMLQIGIQTTIAVLNNLSEFIRQIDERVSDNPYLDQILLVKEIFRDKRLGWLYKEKGFTQFPFLKLTKYDYLLRHTLQKEMEALREFVYYLDVYIAVGDVAASKNFSYAKAVSKELNLIKAEELHHPSLKNALGNPISFHIESNVIFLTGANMAGKSTLMKAFGISIYLAHMGFQLLRKLWSFL